MRIAGLSIFIGFLWVSTAFGQRDAPVWESYLPKISIYHENSHRHAAITIDFLFKKNGGPYEHNEHQAYILVYLKKDEEQILKLADNSQLVSKQNEKTKLFLEVLVDKKLVVPLGSQAAKINSRNGSPPRFADVKGNPQRAGVDNLDASSFPFKFTFTYETLFQSVQKLGNFRSANVTMVGKSTWFDDKFKLMVFVPVNDSGHATKVSPRLRETHDFANVMNSDTSLLYFRPLPYEFGFKKYEEDTLLVYIN
ncbi:MAG TPA: hypothetical protein VKA60_12565 [Blastocatellia bacterium]|nr:hypothetical protein [Blastocatellia bacterium]